MRDIESFYEVDKPTAEVAIVLGPRLREEIRRRVRELETRGRGISQMERQLVGLRQLLTIPERRQP